MDFEIDIRQLREILAGNIKKQRKHLGLTQEKLAEIADLSSNMVNDIEGCRTWVSDKTILKLAKALKLDVYQLLLPKYGTQNGGSYISRKGVLQLKQTIERVFDEILR
ncbi:MAG: helix-turn-helix domain-containing protein [Treponema sp.]|jgi:transcriptional regulator with XRE-family HTH domain|nr:helix-turn-helix domain-containing protein [Treponema sp.]